MEDFPDPLRPIRHEKLDKDIAKLSRDLKLLTVIDER
jgi:hypothetical protein